MRQYIRHPTTIPVEYNILGVTTNKINQDQMSNVSEGGLCFQADRDIDLTSQVRIKIPFTEPVFEAVGEVAWCQRVNSHYEIGVKFIDEQTEFKLRMVEQICHIEEYRKNILEKEGKDLTGEEAAMEWIAKYAGDFPR